MRVQLQKLTGTNPHINLEHSTDTDQPDMSKVRELFMDVYCIDGGECTNPLTPRVIKYGRMIKHGLVYELSEGKGFTGGKIIGLTFLTLGGKQCPNLNGAYGSVADALLAVKRIRRLSVTDMRRGQYSSEVLSNKVRNELRDLVTTEVKIRRKGGKL